MLKRFNKFLLYETVLTLLRVLIVITVLTLFTACTPLTRFDQFIEQFQLINIDGVIYGRPLSGGLDNRICL